jgi:hypothetical protein
MKTIAQIFIILCFGQLVIAQTATLTTTKSLRSAKKYFTRNIIEDKQGGFHSIIIPKPVEYKNSDYVYIDHIDSAMHRTSHKILNLKEGHKRLRYEYIIEQDEKLWLFCSFSEKKIQKNTLYMQELSTSSWQRIGELKKITAINYNSHKDPGQFHFTYSAVGNNFLIFAQAPTSTSSSNLRVVMTVLDADFTVKDTQHLNWNVQAGSIKFKNVFYDGGHLVFFAHQLVSQEYVFYYRNSKEENLKRSVVTGKGKSISGVKVYWDRDKVVCHGLYKQTMDGTVSGIFSVDFADGNFTNYSEDPLFTEEKKLFSPGNNNNVWKNLRLKKVINRGKGISLLVCEQSKDFTVAYQNYNQSSYYGGGGYYGGYGGYAYGGNGYYSTEFVEYESFNNVIVIAVKDGKEIWRKLVPKKQSIQNLVSYWGSIAINSTQKGLFLYFNNSTEPPTSEDGITEFSGEKQYSLTEVFIDDSGTMKRIEVYRASSTTREIPVISSFHFTDDSMIFLGRKGTSTKFYKLKTKD